jgi:hypothetical protein
MVLLHHCAASFGQDFPGCRTMTSSPLYLSPYAQARFVQRNLQNSIIAFDNLNKIA